MKGRTSISVPNLIEKPKVTNILLHSEQHLDSELQNENPLHYNLHPLNSLRHSKIKRNSLTCSIHQT